jgi:hypothetical protein
MTGTGNQAEGGGLSWYILQLVTRLHNLGWFVVVVSLSVRMLLSWLLQAFNMNPKTKDLVGVRQAEEKASHVGLRVMQTADQQIGWEAQLAQKACTAESA